MTLGEFKKIFFWEYIHRIWGRLIGLTFFIPLLYFWLKGYFNKSEKKLISIITSLGFFQAFMGWYMVESGLVDQPDVSHFRLSVHLITAFIIYSLLLYYFWNIHLGRRETYIKRIFLFHYYFYLLLFWLVRLSLVQKLDCHTITSLTWEMVFYHQF